MGGLLSLIFGSEDDPAVQKAKEKRRLERRKQLKQQRDESDRLREKLQQELQGNKSPNGDGAPEDLHEQYSFQKDAANAPSPKARIQLDAFSTGVNGGVSRQSGYVHGRSLEMPGPKFGPDPKDIIKDSTAPSGPNLKRPV